MGNLYYPSTEQVRHTIVDVDREMPKDHIIWSLLTFVYCNPFCLGLAALIHSVKARDRKVVGDTEGARRYGSTAGTLNVIATLLICLIVIFAFIVIVSLPAPSGAAVNSTTTGRIGH